MGLAVKPNSQTPALVWDLSATSLIVLMPLLVFFKYNNYPLLSSEALTGLLLVLIPGLILGGLMHLGRNIGRIIVITSLLVLLIDIQTSWITTIGLRLFICILVCGGISWLIRKKISQLMVLVFGAMIIGTIVQPSGKMLQSQGDFPGSGTSTQPFVLHLILDEYAAPESFDIRYDQNEDFSKKVQAFFLDNDFTLYSRAYSRLYHTRESIPNTLNKGLREKPNSFWDGEFFEGILLSQNDWFDRLIGLGYDLHVIQPQYIDFIGPDTQTASSTTYVLETINSLVGLDFAMKEKIQFIFGNYFRLSWFLGNFRDSYADFSQSTLATALKLPKFDFSGNYFSPLSSMNMVDDLEEMLPNARPGQAVFAHLVLPHSPYAFESDCTLKPKSTMWMYFTSPGCFPARNDSTTRAERYPVYFDQIQCTNNRLEDIFNAVKRAGIWDDSLIIIHGDHGSRLNMLELFPKNADQLVDSEFMDGHGTLLAIKYPQGQAILNRQMVPLSDVFEQLFLSSNQAWPPSVYVPSQETIDNPWVLLNDRHQKMIRHPMPEFANGVAGARIQTGVSP